LLVHRLYLYICSPCASINLCIGKRGDRNMPFS
jgi:hypothetical protein